MRRSVWFLVAAQIVLSGCARVPPPPYPLAFTLNGSTPRLLQTSSEITVPLTIQNTGQTAWDATRVHVSYHWLWVVPRELLKRSRTLPYHDGIRTELPAAVAPGAGVTVQGRLLAPRVPGLYWLQWDMVEEGVTWFAQVAPRQPRQLVVVLPTAAGLFAPLPLVAAVAGLILIRRRARVAALADVFWCAAALIAKPLVLGQEALLEPTPGAYWLMVTTAVALPLLGLALWGPRVRVWALLGCGILATLLLLGDALYYRFFGDVLSASAILAARQTGQVWGSIRSLLDPAMFWLVADAPFAFWLAVRLMRPPADPLVIRRHRTVAAAMLALIVVVSLPPLVPLVRASRLDQTFRDRAVMEQLGPLGYHGYDAWTYARSRVFRPRVTAEQLADTRAWFADRAVLRAGTGPRFAAAAGRNLIVLQVESLQDFVVDYRVDGQEVMPRLRRWREEALRFTNVTDQTSEGRTSDAEFTALVSLLPIDHGAVAFRHAGNQLVGLPRVLAERGYATLSAVPFEAGFWNRRVMHPSYGFERSLFEPDFQLTEQIGWGLNDRDFLQQMVPRLSELRRPFAAWLITLSLHHPFEDFPDAHKALQLGSLEGTSFGNYLHTMHFFDRALDDFERSLARAGLLDSSMIVVFGDHDAGFAREKGLAQTIGIGTDAPSWELNDRIPFFVNVPLARDPLAGDMTMAAGQTDFAPTMLALLGIDAAPLPYMGRNLLGSPGDSPIVRPYGEWLDRAHLFTSPSGSDGGGNCHAAAGGAAVDARECRAANEAARRARDVSRLVVAGDLQQQLREALR